MNAIKVAIDNRRFEDFTRLISPLSKLSDDDSEKIIFKICHKGDVRFLNYLIEKGLVTSKKLKNPMYLKTAAAFNHTEIVETLVSIGPNVKFDYHDIRNDLLILTSSNDYPDLVQYFIKEGGDPNAQDNSALALACQCGSLRVVKILVRHGADIYAKDGSFIEICDELSYYDIVDYFVLMGMPKEGLSDSALKYIDFMDKKRIRAANKIRNWWGPLLRRINPEFVMKEAAESWNRVEKMYLEKCA